MLTIALTGGIASGKTLISDQFAALDVPIVDSDLLAREVVAPESAGLRALIAEFGTAVVGADGALNRPALRQRIFDEPEARNAVNAILHPMIRQLADARMMEHRIVGAAYAIQVIPLLVETGQHKRFDRVLLVDVPREVQLARLIRRDGIASVDAEAILAAQATRQQRLAIADDVIANDGEPQHTDEKVRQLHKKYLLLAEG